MSEYNIQMNKYNALNAGYDQLYPVTKIKNVDGLDTALQKKAPAGYGLGEKAKSIDSWDDALVNGWYMAPAPSGVGSGNIWGRVDCLSATYLVQTVYADNNKNSARRFRIGSVFSEWEWVNPPMILGKEYRTTERHNGKPVYKMAIPWPTAFPHTATNQVEVASLKYDDISIIGIDCTAKAAVSKQTQKLPIMKEDGSGTVAAYTNVERYSNGSVLVQITSTIDMTEWLVNSLVICYTKN